MGNCCRTASSMEWGGEDWGSLTSKNRRRTSSRKVFDEGHEFISTWSIQKEKFLDTLRAYSDANGKVKIKLSKRELEVLVGGLEKKQQQPKMMKKKEGQVSAEQVLVRLRNARDHHRPWSPVLQSIPEVNSEC